MIMAAEDDVRWCDIGCIVDTSPAPAFALKAAAAPDGTGVALSWRVE